MKKLALALLLAVGLGTTSCVGPFHAFNTVSSWNSRVTNSKVVNELLYLGMWIIPVYPIAAVGDSLIFNSVEFWGGENPIQKPADFTNQDQLGSGN